MARRQLISSVFLLLMFWKFRGEEFGYERKSVQGRPAMMAMARKSTAPRRFSRRTRSITMKHFGKFVLVVLAFGGVVGLVAAMMLAAAPSPVTCRPVRGTIHSVFTTQNCASPVGLCTTGTITDAGILDGSTTFAALAVAPSAGLQGEPQANLSYSGQLTILATNGTLVTKDLGVLDVNHSAFTEIERPASGSGIFANPGSSVFYISGSIVDNGQAFQGDLTGTVCTSGD